MQRTEIEEKLKLNCNFRMMKKKDCIYYEEWKKTRDLKRESRFWDCYWIVHDIPEINSSIKIENIFLTPRTEDSHWKINQSLPTSKGLKPISTQRTKPKKFYMVTRRKWGIQLFENDGSSKSTTTYYSQPIPRKSRWKLARFRNSSQKSDQCWQYPKCQPTTVSSTSLTWPSPTILQNFTSGIMKWLWYSNTGTEKPLLQP